ncbi:MAG: contractile injection system tape measure protein [Bacteroidota bacterium]
MHTIHNIVFEVDVNYDNSLVSWEQYYVDFFQERLLPRVERMCDDWDRKHPNSKCVIDTIDINVNVGDLDLESLQKEITQQISQQLHSIQSDGTTTDSKLVATITKEESPFEGLLSYLQNGILSAHISVKTFKEWLGAVAEFTSVEKNKLTALFSTKTETIARMLSLLRNNYEKFVNIVSEKQQITAHYVKLEKAFFQQFLKELCAQFKLSYSKEEAEIWHQTLGFSSSLPQFSKTLIQLLTPKAQAEHKRLMKVNESELAISVLQAITQNEIGKSISINAAKIATIRKDERIQSQKSNTSTIAQRTTQKSADAVHTIKEKESSSQQKITDATKTQTNTKISETLQAEENNKKNTVKNKETNKTNNTQTHQTTEAHSEEAHTTNNSKSTATEKGSTTDTTKAKTAKEAETTNLAKAKNNTSQTPFSRNRTITNDINLTTEKAGIILLHPFLTRFFNGVGLVNENNEIEDIGKACMLLHFLATETEEVTDVELTLEKILLGIPVETIINYQTPLTDHDKELCEELLKAVLEHWVVLKKSTINTLRDMFLKREGQLTVTKNSINLKIEQAAQDILLEKVPWNISLIRLKWMEKMMHVEWQK